MVSKVSKEHSVKCQTIQENWLYVVLKHMTSLALKHRVTSHRTWILILVLRIRVWWDMIHSWNVDAGLLVSDTTDLSAVARNQKESNVITQIITFQFSSLQVLETKKTRTALPVPVKVTNWRDNVSTMYDKRRYAACVSYGSRRRLRHTRYKLVPLWRHVLLWCTPITTKL